MTKAVEKKQNIIFFGTPDIAVWVLEELQKAGFVPELIITNPDRPKGRKMELTPPPAKVWALDHDVEVFQPENLSDPEVEEKLCRYDSDLYVVIAYGGIIPHEILKIPKHGVLNVHPSLLPELRGASPIRSAILQDKKETGVSIMLMDEELDHGPILSQEVFVAEEWPIDGEELDKKLAIMGGKLLGDTIPEWVAGNIDSQEQDHKAATYSTKITKGMAELEIDPFSLPIGEDAYNALLKIRAFSGWPEAFFIREGKRVKIKDADLDENGILEITRVTPEGKKEMDFGEYLKSLK
jgi:methionyl-tRNA formyltransferase